MTKILVETLKNNPSERVPFWFMRQAGRYLPEYREVRAQTKSFLDFCYNSDLAVEVTLQPLRRFHMDAAIVFADILVVPDALGQKTWFEAGHGPRLEPIQNRTAYEKLSLANFHDHLAPIYESLRRLRAILPDETALIGFAGAPWTVASYMVEGSGSKDQGKARQLGYKDPQLFAELIHLLADMTAEYLIAQIDAGADVVQIFDSWSSALPEPVFQAWVIEPTRYIVEKIRKVHQETPIIGFPRLGGFDMIAYAAQTGVTGLSLDTGVNFDWIKKSVPTNICLQGNLDPHLVVAGGPAMQKETDRILEAFKDRPHIFNLGHGFVPETPIDHVEKLSQQILAFRR